MYLGFYTKPKSKLYKMSLKVSYELQCCEDVQKLLSLLEETRSSISNNGLQISDINMQIYNI